jgi:hypothetical protein
MPALGGARHKSVGKMIGRDERMRPRTHYYRRWNEDRNDMYNALANEDRNDMYRRVMPDGLDKWPLLKLMTSSTRFMHTHTKPTPPGGFNIERVFLQDCIKRLCSELVYK